MKYFWIDDIWVTGYLAAKVGIKHLDMLRFWTTSMEQLLLMKSLQNPDNFHHDFISGPLVPEYRLALSMEQRANWCFKYNCFNNIYNKEHTVSNEDLSNDQALLKLIKIRHKTNLLSENL